MSFKKRDGKETIILVDVDDLLNSGRNDEIEHQELKQGLIKLLRPFLAEAVLIAVYFLTE